MTKVAANSLDIVIRELGHRARLELNEAERIRNILNSEEASLDKLRGLLVAAIRKDLPVNKQSLAKHLRQTAADQLFIDQPTYSALSKQ